MKVRALSMPPAKEPRAVEFRRLRIEDLDAYFALRLRALAQAPSAFMTTLAEEKARGNARFAETLSHAGTDRAIFGAVENGLVVGSVGVLREDRVKTAHKANLVGMFVDVDRRGRGLGGRLVDLAIRFARDEMRAGVLYLCVESGNAEARRLYEAKGFQTWGVEPRAMAGDGRYFDEHHMALLFER